MLESLRDVADRLTATPIATDPECSTCKGKRHYSIGRDTNGIEQRMACLCPNLVITTIKRTDPIGTVYGSQTGKRYLWNAQTHEWDCIDV